MRPNEVTVTRSFRSIGQGLETPEDNFDVFIASLANTCREAMESHSIREVRELRVEPEMESFGGTIDTFRLTITGLPGKFVFEED